MLFSQGDGGSDAEKFEQLLQQLSQMLGEPDVEKLREHLRESGITPETISRMAISGLTPNGAFSMFPGSSPMSFASDLLTGDSGPINWKLASEVARQAIMREGDPALTAAQAAQYRQALQVATLWLDAVTEFSPPQAPAQAWTQAQWLEATMPTWRQICEPVATNATKALSGAMREALDPGNLPAELQSSLPPQLAQLFSSAEDDAHPDGGGAFFGFAEKMAAAMFGMQVGQALSALALEALGYTAIGLPMVGEPQLALVGAGVSDFGDGLEIPTAEVTAFVAVREAAHARLFAAAPWLRHHILNLLQRYAQNIDLDMAAIEQAAQAVNPADLSSLQEALSGGIFSPTISAAQQQILDELNVALAVVEGWVEEVTLRATLPHLSHAIALDEMLRRKRAAGSPAEKLFANLVGLRLAPKRSRDAAKLWSLLTAQWGPQRRDAIWSHPSQLPTAAELDDPQSLIEARESQAQGDSIDDELAKILDGTLDYAEGLSPETESEGDAKATE